MVYRDDDVYYDSNLVGRFTVRSCPNGKYEEFREVLRVNFQTHDANHVYAENHRYTGGSEYWIHVHDDATLWKAVATQLYVWNWDKGDELQLYVDLGDGTWVRKLAGSPRYLPPFVHDLRYRHQPVIGPLVEMYDPEPYRLPGWQRFWHMTEDEEADPDDEEAALDDEEVVAEDDEAFDDDEAP